MQRFDDPRIMIRTLAGLPITILLLMYFEHQPVTEKYLCAMLDKTDKTVAKALIVLREFDMIIRTTQGWAVLEATQLILGQLALPVDTTVAKSRKISDSLLPSSSCSLNKNQPIDTVEEEQENRNFSDCHKSALRAGIRDPKASALARLPHVTPEFITAHVDKALEEGNPIGTAIHRIENNWPAPTPKESHADGRRYTNGSFSEFVHQGEIEEDGHATFCLWQDLIGTVETGPRAGQPLRGQFCKEPTANGSRFCPRHLRLAATQEQS